MFILEGIEEIIEIFIEVFKGSKEFIKSITIEDIWGGIALTIL